MQWYIRLCTTRQALNRCKYAGTYYERHHIIPKSLGGTNDKTNLVLLSAREHYIAHLLLYNHYKSICDNYAFRKMAYALVSMASTNKNMQRMSLTSRQYEIIKEAAHFSRAGHKVSDTTNYKKPKSKSHADAIRRARLQASPRTNATRQRMSEKLKGRINMQNLKISTCPHCQKTGQYVAMQRWHFNNCKHMEVVYAKLA